MIVTYVPQKPRSEAQRIADAAWDREWIDSHPSVNELDDPAPAVQYGAAAVATSNAPSAH
jgi:hypothetical protein